MRTHRISFVGLKVSRSLLLVVLTQFCLCLRYGSIELLGAIIVIDRANCEMVSLLSREDEMELLILRISFKL